MAVSDKTAAEILSKCARHCCICRKFRPLHLQIHHLVEIAEGGDNNFDNLIPICSYCHSDVHTITKLTRRFTIEELKRHRDSVYDLIKKGKLPSSESLISDQDIDYIIDQMASRINNKFEKKYDKRSLQILYAAAVEEERIIKFKKIEAKKGNEDKFKSFSIEIGNYLFISETDKNGLPKVLSLLIRERLVEKVDKNSYKVTLKGLTLVEEEFETYDKYIVKKVKCLNCSLHFVIFTWYPKRHTKNNIYCPECGNNQGNFAVWKQQKFGFIFQEVPGDAMLDMN